MPGWAPAGVELTRDPDCSAFTLSVSGKVVRTSRAQRRAPGTGSGAEERVGSARPEQVRVRRAEAVTQEVPLREQPVGGGVVVAQQVVQALVQALQLLAQ